MFGDSNDRLLNTLADLVSINSVNPNYQDGVPEASIADYVEDYFARRGVETWRQQVYPQRPNVIARIPGKNPKGRIVLEAHLDTVSAHGMSIDPWKPEIRDGKLYGRGSCDTKGGMAAMMHAVASLAAESVSPRREVLFAATVDEEHSYRGVVALCNSLDPGPVEKSVLEHGSSPRSPLQADAAIVAEPTMLRPVIASKGLVRWKIVTRGKAAHSSKPHLGYNAIEAMAHVVTALQKDTLLLSKRVHPLLGPATCNIGVIRGGTQINFVPDRCEIEIDRRMLPGESCVEVLDHYQQLLDSVAAKHAGIEMTMEPPMLSDCPLESAADSVAVKTMRRILKDLGHDPTPVGVPFCSDASKFGALGIPSLILGPGSIDQAHAAIEFVDCGQVIEAAAIYRKFILEFG